MPFGLRFLKAVGVDVLVLVFDVMTGRVFLKCAFWYGRCVEECSKYQVEASSLFISQY